ncbi:MAG TPA: hypothetical protein VM265_06160 [Sphingomicrobium sp.]|nr:hypothetical protein [Sphingomicrobium sp.]
MTFLLKDPQAVLDYAVDWGAEYLGGDVLASSDWSVIPEEPGGVTIAGSSFDSAIATVKAAGGVAGRLYRLCNHVVLASGRIDSRSILLRLEAR